MRLIRRLIYLTTTRPDIAFVVQQLSQHVSQHRVIHYRAAIRILQYVKSFSAKGLFYEHKTDLSLSGFADSDWATCRSVTGYTIFLGSSLVSWKSKKQSTVSRSSCEAEYQALVALTYEVQWLHTLFTELNIKFHKPTSLYCDNRSAVYLAHNPTFHECTKHIEIDSHLIREKIELRIIKLFPISSGAYIADLLTKPLTSPSFLHLISKLGVIELHGPACGDVKETISYWIQFVSLFPINS